MFRSITAEQAFHWLDKFHFLNAPRIPGLGPEGPISFKAAGLFNLDFPDGRRPVSPKQLQSLFLASGTSSFSTYMARPEALALLLLGMDKIHFAPVVGMPEAPSIPG